MPDRSFPKDSEEKTRVENGRVDPTAAAPTSLGSATGSGAGMSAPLKQDVSEEPVYDLPWNYDDDRLVLLVRDPWTLFTYWDFHPDTVERASEGLGASSRMLMRVLKISGREQHVIKELEVDLGWRSYYFYQLEPNRDYRVEVVCADADGRETPVGRRSNIASLPPAQPSPWVEDRFASIPIDVTLPEASVFAQGRIAAGAGGPGRMHSRAWELSGGEQMTAHEASSESSVQSGHGGRGWSGSFVRQ